MDAVAVLALSLALDRDMPRVLQETTEELERLRGAVARAGLLWEGGDLALPSGSSLPELYIAFEDTHSMLMTELNRSSLRSDAIFAAVMSLESLSRNELAAAILQAMSLQPFTHGAGV